MESARLPNGMTDGAELEGLLGAAGATAVTAAAAAAAAEAFDRWQCQALIT